ncbi:hypothetical protein D3C86_1615270 [compost metagenome]
MQCIYTTHIRCIKLLGRIIINCIYSRSVLPGGTVYIHITRKLGAPVTIAQFIAKYFFANSIRILFILITSENGFENRCLFKIANIGKHVMVLINVVVCTTFGLISKIVHFCTFTRRIRV